MKKIFTALSTLLVAVFVAIYLVKDQAYIAIYDYQTVHLPGQRDDMETLSKEEFTSELDKFAQEENSLVARRIIEPGQEAGTKFTYEFYGKQTHPPQFEEASNESKKVSDLTSEYTIISGDLSAEKLSDKLASLGYITEIIEPISIFELILPFYVSPSFLLAFGVIILTYLAILVIERTKELRSVGVKKISGMSLANLITESLLKDFKTILVSYLVSALVGGGFLLVGKTLNFKFIKILLLALGLYSLLLVVLSLLSTLIYLLTNGGRKQLTQLLKGRLPVNSLLSIMLVGQLLGVVLVGVGINKAAEAYRTYQTYQKSDNEWANNDNFYKVSYRGISPLTEPEEDLTTFEKLFPFIEDNIQNQGGLFIESNVYKMPEPGYEDAFYEFPDYVGIDEYLPGANTIYVSPSYLKEQNIELDPEMIDKLENLQEGEFGLLLPKPLKTNERYYKNLYIQEMDNRINFMNELLSADQSEDSIEFTPLVAYLEEGKERYIYSTISHMQYLTDPIIVVMTPRSTGKSPGSIMYWGDMLNQAVFFKGYDETMELAKKHDIDSYIISLEKLQLQYLTSTNAYKTEFTMLLIGSLLGVASAIMLFSTMNGLYFEKFRRQIFIKRLAGMTFFQNHRTYLLTQLASFILAMLVVWLITKNIEVALLTVSIFMLLAFILVGWQTERENKQAVSVIKGK